MTQTTEVTRKVNVSEYREEAASELQRILEFWMLHSLDEEQGGFVGHMDNSGHVQAGAPKGAVLNARILWTFSAAYRHTKDKEHLDLAQRAYSYFVHHFLDEVFGGVYWALSANGNPLNTRKQIYALAFAVYGLSEYHRATQHRAALEGAKQLYFWIERYAFDREYGGYFEAFSRDGKLLEDLRLSPKDRNDPKTMNTHLHILEAYANLYRVWPEPQLAQQMEGLIRIFTDKIIDAETGHMHLFFTREWDTTGELVSYGHDIEASWLLLEAAEVLGNQRLVEEVKDLALSMARATSEGLQPDGSLYHEMNLARQHFDTHREWWVSAEAMVGFLNAYQISGDSSFLEQSWGSWLFAKNFLLDKEHGEWVWGVMDDYSRMDEYKIGFWKCPYHNSRACLEVMERCEQLLNG